MSCVRFMSPCLEGGRDEAKLVNRARYIANHPGVEISVGIRGLPDRICEEEHRYI